MRAVSNLSRMGKGQASRDAYSDRRGHGGSRRGDRSRLRKLGYAVDIVADGEEADELLRTESYNLVVLDLMLPGIGGKEVLHRLRRRRSRTPVLVLTARSDVDDKVGALDYGADDYLVKPFDFRELEARCRALLRRPHGMAARRGDSAT